MHVKGALLVMKKTASILCLVLFLALAAQTVLADSITLTPGTMTVDVDPENGDLYVHWIYVSDLHPTEDMVYGSFGEWVRRITR